MKTTPIGPFLGINNRVPDFALRKSTAQLSGNYLREAENVDIDNARRLRRREGEVLLQAMTAPHSLYMISDTQGYLVRSSVMYLATLSPTYSEAFAKSLTSNARMSWVEEGGDLFFSNGTDSGRITAGAFYPLGMPTPTAPGVATTTGSMFEGTYQVAVSYYNAATGEEGGVSPSNNPVLGTAGGLIVALPAATQGATHVNVYVSTVNGSIPMLAGSYVVGTASATFSAQPVTDREAPQRFEAQLPAGRLFMSNGRLCSFSGKDLYVGLPFRYGYYDIVAGWTAFKDNVTVAAANQKGTYVATEVNTYWVPGDLGDVKELISEPFPFGAVLGTEWRHPATSDIGWFSENGFIVANTQGEAVPVTFDVLDIDSVPSEGVSNIRWTGGFVRVYSCGYCMNLENNHPTKYVGYDFTSFSGDYGTKIDGIYTLTDSVAKVSAKVGFGKQDFSTEELKHLPNVYLGCSSDEPLEMQVQWPDPRTGEIQDYTYPARNADASVRMQRVDVGKGARSSWFDLTVYNQSGSDFTLASVSFTPVASGRRI